MSTPKFRVAICGGGISGLCLAVALSRHQDIEVNVYESAERFKEIGAGVMIWARTWHILELLGLADAFSKATHTPPDDPSVGYGYRRSDRLEGFDWNWVPMPYGCIRFHRAHFLDVFVDHLPEGVAHFRKRLDSYSKQDDGHINLRFADGTSALCDVLVGCDGIKSVVRREILRAKADEQGQPDLLKLIEPKWTGTIAYRGLVPVTQLPHKDNGTKHRTIDTPMMYCGKNKHVVAYSIAQGEVVNVVAYVTDLARTDTEYGTEWVTDSSKEEVLQHFSGWESEVSELLERIDKPTKWAIHHLHPLPFFVADRAVLLGDAAHAMSPHLGAGATQAIEDAFILATVLGAATPNNLDAALAAYQETRLPGANHVLKSHFEAGLMFEFNSPFAEDYDTLGPAIARQWAFLTETTPEGEAERAMNVFSALQRR